LAIGPAHSFYNYLRATREPFYSFLISLPLIFSYELLIFLLNHSDVTGLRNGADIIFRQLFSIFDVYGFYAVGLVLIIIFLFSYYFYERSGREIRFRFYYFPLAVAESSIYAGILFLIFSEIADFDISLGLNAKQNFVLILGAGVYEEFIFRVILITGFNFFLTQILRLGKAGSYFLSVVASSFVFSLFHYLGVYGEAFILKTFVLRFLSGVYLSGVYLFRGYGLAAYTHSIYDIMVFI